MASTISKGDSVTPLEALILNVTAQGGSAQSIIDQGYSHWQLAQATRDALRAGYLVRKEEHLEVTLAGLQQLNRVSEISKRERLGPLDHCRIDSEEKLRSYKIGRQALDQIRNRVRT